MALHGSVEEAGLPNVLQLLALGGKTGCIAVERATILGEIHLDNGVVVWAEIVSAGDRLGDHLVRSGKITRDQLRQAIETLTRNAAHTLAEVLVESGSLSRGELDRFIQHQVEEAIYLMCSWTDGQFNFSATSKPPRHATLVSLQAERLLLEAGRRADDWEVIRQVIPSFDRVYRRSSLRPGHAGDEHTAEQHRILPLLDGTRDVNGLIELSGLSAFEVGKALYELIAGGHAQLLERSSAARHFDEAELLAYAERSGVFADAEQRKDAARHIADCNLCGSRLRGVHVRRTQEQTKQTTQTKETTQTPTPSPRSPSPKPPPPRPLVPTPPVPMPPAPSRSDPRLSKDIVWLTSPQEADEIRRTTQRPAQLPPVAKAPAPPPLPAPPPPPSPPPPPPAPPTPKTSVTAPLQIVPKPRAKPDEAPATVPPVKKRPVRSLAAAGVVVVALAGGYVALRPGRPRPAVQTPQTLQTPQTPAPSVQTPQTPQAPSADSPVVTATAPHRDSVRPTAIVTPPPARDTTRSPAPVRPAPPRDTTPRAPPPPTLALAPDNELAAGGWRVIDRAEAINALGGRIGAIPGLRIESIASSEARGRTRVRIAQIARTGQRIVLIETATGDASAGASRATAVSVMPPEADGEAIGSASLGNLQITARSNLPADALRSLLARLGAVTQP